MSYPLPGTKFYEMVREQLGDKTHWRDSNDLEMMFQGTYTSDFYRRVRDLIHAQVSLHNGGHASASLEFHHDKRELERRWHELLAHEQRFRNEWSPASAAL